jgi:cellobiose phosphorylase
MGLDSSDYTPRVEDDLKLLDALHDRLYYKANRWNADKKEWEELTVAYFIAQPENRINLVINAYINHGTMTVDEARRFAKWVLDRTGP